MQHDKLKGTFLREGARKHLAASPRFNVFLTNIASVQESYPVSQTEAPPQTKESRGPEKALQRILLNIRGCLAASSPTGFP